MVALHLRRPGTPPPSARPSPWLQLGGLAWLLTGCLAVPGGEGELCEAPCDEEVCATVTCDPVQGCVYAPGPEVACDDGNACTQADKCVQGACTGSDLACDDGDPCSMDSCNPTTGCVHSASSGGGCDDGDACTEKDSCVLGKCGGTPLTCADEDPCTDDSCVAGKGCMHSERSGACEDGDACTEGDSCVQGQCLAGKQVACDDGNPCTDDVCQPKKGCVATANGAACDDGDACTTDDACSGKKCVGGPALKCDDDNACTSDSCAPGAGCLYEPASGPCDDGDACTPESACDFGACKGTGQVVCDDKNPCTDDVCEAAKGCQHPPNTATCDDGDPCTAQSACEQGQCAGKGAVYCDDANTCTTDMCVAGKGCTHQPVGGACDDGDPCTPADTCTAGSCVAAAPTACDTCGNGALNLGPAKAPPACPDPGKLTVVQTAAQLDVWRAAPTTSLRIAGSIHTAGAPVNLATACDVELAATGQLSGVGHLVIHARKILLSGQIQAIGDVHMTAKEGLTLTEQANIGGPPQSLTLESVSLVVDGGSSWVKSLCLEANTIAIGPKKAGLAGAGLHKGAGAAKVRSLAALTLQGTIEAGAGAHLQAGEDLTCAANAALSGQGDTQITAGKSLQWNGKLEKPTGAVMGGGTDLTLGKGSAIALGGALSLSATGKLRLEGSLKTPAAFSATTEGELQLAEGAGLEVGATTLQTKGALLWSGSLTKTGQLQVKAATLTMLTAGVIQGSGSTDIALGLDKSSIGGHIEGTGNLIIGSGNLILTAYSALLGHENLVMKVSQRLDVDGKITKNKGVYLEAPEYLVVDAQAIEGNEACAIKGVALPGSLTPVGCAQLP